MTPSDVSADGMNHFFYTKVAAVSASTRDAIHHRSPQRCAVFCTFFRPLTIIDVVAAVRALPDKQCASDPLSTHVLKDNVDVLALFVVELLNRLLVLVVVPSKPTSSRC